MDEGKCHRLYRPHTTRFIAHMKNAPIHFRVIANSRPIELYSFTQGEAAIFLESIDDLNAIGWRRLRHSGYGSCLTARVLLTSQPFRLGLLGDLIDRVANGVCRTTMTSPGVSNEEKYSSLVYFRQASHLLRRITQTENKGDKGCTALRAKAPRYPLPPKFYSSCRLKRLRKRSTRPAESRIRCVPVKKGWQLEHTSTFSTGLTLRVLKLLPQAQLTVDSTYSG
jgi:hypothetical protein